MLGAVIAEYIWEIWQKDQELPAGEELNEARLTSGILELLGVAKAVVEGDTDFETLTDEVQYWTYELLHEYAHDDFEQECDGLAGCIWSVPLGAVSAGPEEAEDLTERIADAEEASQPQEAAALAGAMWTACSGADREKIAGYVLAQDLPQTSPVAYGAGALLLADDFLGAVTEAIDHGFGREAAVCAGALAEPLYEIPEEYIDGAMNSFNHDLRQIIEDYYDFVMAQRADR